MFGIVKCTCLFLEPKRSFMLWWRVGGTEGDMYNAVQQRVGGGGRMVIHAAGEGRRT